jgi:hypothetical protein
MTAAALGLGRGPDWQPGDEIPLGRDLALQVIGVKAGMELEDDPVLIVEPQPA